MTGLGIRLSEFMLGHTEVRGKVYYDIKCPCGWHEESYENMNHALSDAREHLADDHKNDTSANKSGNNAYREGSVVDYYKIRDTVHYEFTCPCGTNVAGYPSRKDAESDLNDHLIDVHDEAYEPYGPKNYKKEATVVKGRDGLYQWSCACGSGNYGNLMPSEAAASLSNHLMNNHRVNASIDELLPKQEPVKQEPFTWKISHTGGGQYRYICSCGAVSSAVGGSNLDMVAKYLEVHLTYPHKQPTTAAEIIKQFNERSFFNKVEIKQTIYDNSYYWYWNCPCGTVSGYAAYPDTTTTKLLCEHLKRDHDEDYSEEYIKNHNIHKHKPTMRVANYHVSIGCWTCNLPLFDDNVEQMEFVMAPEAIE